MLKQLFLFVVICSSFACRELLAQSQWQPYCLLHGQYGKTYYDASRNRVYSIDVPSKSFYSDDGGRTWEQMKFEGLRTLYSTAQFRDFEVCSNGDIFLRVYAYSSVPISFISKDGGDSFERYVKTDINVVDTSQMDNGFNSSECMVAEPSRVLFNHNHSTDPPMIYWSDDDGRTFYKFGGLENPIFGFGHGRSLIEPWPGDVGIPTIGLWMILKQGSNIPELTTVPDTITNWVTTSKGSVLGFDNSHLDRVYFRKFSESEFRPFEPVRQGKSSPWPRALLVSVINDSTLTLVSEEGHVFVYTDSDSVPRMIYDGGSLRTRDLQWTGVSENYVHCVVTKPWMHADSMVRIVSVDPVTEVVTENGKPGTVRGGGQFDVLNNGHLYCAIDTSTWFMGIQYTRNAGRTWVLPQSDTGVTGLPSPYTYRVFKNEGENEFYFAIEQSGMLMQKEGDSVVVACQISVNSTYNDVPGSGLGTDFTRVITDGISYPDATLPDENWVGGDVLVRYSKSFQSGDTLLRARTLVVDRFNTDVAAVGADSLYQTTDGGTTWRLLTPTSGISPVQTDYKQLGDVCMLSESNIVVGLLGATSRVDTTVYHIAAGGIFHSTDAGITWTQSAGTDSTMYVHQIERLSNNALVALFRRVEFQPDTNYKEIAFINAFYSGSAVLRSEDNGRSWHTVFEQGFIETNRFNNPKLVVGTDRIWFVHPASGVWCSLDNANTFHPLDADNTVQPSSLIEQEDGSIIVGAIGGLYMIQEPVISVNSVESGVRSTTKLLSFSGGALHCDASLLPAQVLVYDVQGRLEQTYSLHAPSLTDMKLSSGVHVVVLVSNDGMKRESMVVVSAE